VLLLLFLACADPGADTGVLPAEIRLAWVSAWPGDSWERSRLGLWWALSDLGAVPPADEAGLTVLEADQDRVLYTLDLERVGLSPAAAQALEQAAAPVRDSGEYAFRGSVDTGRFLMATLFEPWRYYAITGACATLGEWQERRRPAEAQDYAVTLSQLTSGDRLLRLGRDPEVDRIALEAGEGTGSLAEGSFTATEHETVDAMANGRQRFAVYDDQGLLLPASRVSPAGQPGRCMWCHQGHLMTGDPANPELPGFLPTADFAQAVGVLQARMEARREQVPVPFDWADQGEVHTWQELLSETFLRPSPARVAREWRVDEGEVGAIVAERGMTLALNEEHPDQGEVLVRAEVDAALAELLPELTARPEHPWYGRDPALWAPVPTLPSARELDPDAAELSGAGLPLPRCQP